MDEIELELCNEFIKGFDELSSCNTTLVIQILCIIQLIEKGVYLPVKLKTKNSSVINGLLKDYSYTGFTLHSEIGIYAVVSYMEIDDLDLKFGAA